jgi:hypothetical protein
LRWSSKHEVQSEGAERSGNSHEEKPFETEAPLRAPAKPSSSKHVPVVQEDDLQIRSRNGTPGAVSQWSWEGWESQFADPFVGLNEGYPTQNVTPTLTNFVQELFTRSRPTSASGKGLHGDPTTTVAAFHHISSVSGEASQHPVDNANDETNEFVVSRLPQATLRRGLNDPSSILVEYYFKDVAGLVSCYDSQMNPFRTTVSRLWTSSPAMNRTLQSMAAACLVDEFPQFARIGLQMRREAMALIEMESVMDEKALLVLLMLGETASWHDPGDLGLPYFNRLKKAVDSLPASGRPSDNNNFLFFQEALVYWEMLLSYVADDTHMVKSTSPVADQHDGSMSRRRPHPWTGIARDTQIALHEVGKLVRRQRKRVRLTSQAEIDKAQLAIKESEELEERLLNMAYPAEADIISPGDTETPVWHLLTIAEVYRCTGMIQLYRAFPDLLARRLPSSDFTHIPGYTEQDMLEQTRNDWLTNLAITTLKLIQSLPIESRTRSLTPFLLVASSSELRLPWDHSLDEDVDDKEVSPQALEVLRMRDFIRNRLKFFLRILAPKPIHVCLELVELVWAKLDAGEKGVYWMDIMFENGWETTMG